MELIINKGPGNLHSILSSLLLAYNLEYFTNQITEQWGMELDKDLAQDMARIRDHKLLDSHEGEIFFDIHLKVSNFFIDTKLLWKSKDLDDYFDKLKGQDTRTIREKLLGNLLPDKQAKVFYLSQILGQEDSLDLEALVNLLDQQAIDNNSRWNFLLLFQNPKPYIEKFIALAKDFLPLYRELEDLYRPRYEDFLLWIEAKLRDQGADFINHYIKMIDLKEFHRVYLSYSHFGLITSLIDASENECYVFLGLLFRDYVDQVISKLDIERHLMTFKVFSDRTRFEIIKILVNEESFGQEIAEKLNISTATVSYHMDFLLGASLVEIKKRGRKVFYRINKDEIRTSMAFLREELKL